MSTMTDEQVDTLNSFYLSEDIEIYADIDENIWYDPSGQTSLIKSEWCDNVKSLYNYAGYFLPEI
jgi:hypothetical protein